MSTRARARAKTISTTDRAADRSAVRARLAAASDRDTLADLVADASTGRADEDRALAIRAAEEVGTERARLLARTAPYRADWPCRWWYRPDLGLDRERHPWDPDDLAEQLERAAEVSE